MTRDEAEAHLVDRFPSTPLNPVAQTILAVSIPWEHSTDYRGVIEFEFRQGEDGLDLDGLREAALAYLGEGNGAVLQFREALARSQAAVKRLRGIAVMVSDRLQGSHRNVPTDSDTWEGWTQTTIKWHGRDGYTAVWHGWRIAQGTPTDVTDRLTAIFRERYALELDSYNTHVYTEEDADNQQPELALSKYDDRPDHYKLGL